MEPNYIKNDIDMSEDGDFEESEPLQDGEMRGQLQELFESPEAQAISKSKHEKFSGSAFQNNSIHANEEQQ